MIGAGIKHRDLHGGNILVPDSHPDQFIIIDLETARDDIVYALDFQKALLSFLCCDDHVNVLYDWCAKYRYDTLWYDNFPIPLHGVRLWEQLLGYDQ